MSSKIKKFFSKMLSCIDEHDIKREFNLEQNKNQQIIFRKRMEVEDIKSQIASVDKRIYEINANTEKIKTRLQNISKLID